MNYEALPKIRLEVESMKHAILQHIGVVGSDLGERLSKEIEHSIESYPWQTEVDIIVHTAITNHIQEYFKYGDGREMIKGALSEAFSKVFKE